MPRHANIFDDIEWRYNQLYEQWFGRGHETKRSNRCSRRLQQELNMDIDLYLERQSRKWGVSANVARYRLHRYHPETFLIVSASFCEVEEREYLAEEERKLLAASSALAELCNTVGDAPACKGNETDLMELPILPELPIDIARVWNRALAGLAGILDLLHDMGDRNL